MGSEFEPVGSTGGAPELLLTTTNLVSGGGTEGIEDVTGKEEAPGGNEDAPGGNEDAPGGDEEMLGTTVCKPEESTSPLAADPSVPELPAGLDGAPDGLFLGVLVPPSGGAWFSSPGGPSLEPLPRSTTSPSTIGPSSGKGTHVVGSRSR